jgi:hypothetical protein
MLEQISEHKSKSSRFRYVYQPTVDNHHNSKTFVDMIEQREKANLQYGDTGGAEQGIFAIHI